MSSMFFCCCIFLVPLLFQQPKGLTTGLLFGARICITVTFTVVYVYAPEVSHRSWFLISKGKWIFILSFSFLIINMSARWKFYTQLNFKISILSQLDYPWVFFFSLTFRFRSSCLWRTIWSQTSLLSKTFYLESEWVQMHRWRCCNPLLADLYEFPELRIN